jgi:GTP cyclohydrolase FolE2
MAHVGLDVVCIAQDEDRISDLVGLQLNAEQVRLADEVKKAGAEVRVVTACPSAQEGVRRPRGARYPRGQKPS